MGVPPIMQFLFSPSHKQDAILKMRDLSDTSLLPVEHILQQMLFFLFDFTYHNDSILPERRLSSWHFDNN